MCKFCALASWLLGRPTLCRPCWRKMYRNKNKNPIKG